MLRLADEAVYLRDGSEVEVGLWKTEEHPAFFHTSLASPDGRDLFFFRATRSRLRAENDYRALLREIPSIPTYSELLVRIRGDALVDTD